MALRYEAVQDEGCQDLRHLQRQPSHRPPGPITVLQGNDSVITQDSCHPFSGSGTRCVDRSFHAEFFLYCGRLFMSFTIGQEASREGKPDLILV